MLGDYTFADVLNVLEFIYTGSVTIESSHFNHFLAVAKNLGLVGIPEIAIDLVPELKERMLDGKRKRKINSVVDENEKENSSIVKNRAPTRNPIRDLLRDSPSPPPEPIQSLAVYSPPRSPQSSDYDPNYSPSPRRPVLKTPRGRNYSSSPERPVKKPLRGRRSMKSILELSSSINFLKCAHCDSSYASRNSIYNHERYCHQNPNRKISRCSICKDEVRPGSMLYHKKRYHAYKPRPLKS